MYKKQGVQPYFRGEAVLSPALNSRTMISFKKGSATSLGTFGVAFATFSVGGWQPCRAPKDACQ